MAEVFGFALSLDSVAQYVGMDEMVIGQEWTANRFFNKLYLLNYRSWCESNLFELQKKKS
jgi:hypothetical protein